MANFNGYVHLTPLAHLFEIYGLNQMMNICLRHCRHKNVCLIFDVWTEGRNAVEIG